MDSGRQERLSRLFTGIQPETDKFLGDTCVQITGIDGTPSVHTVSSYLIELDPYTNYYYYVFKWHCGTTVINYNRKQYEQVGRLVDVSDYWDIYYADPEFPDPIPVNNKWRQNQTVDR